MKRIFVVTMLLLVFFPLVTANLYLTEIMYAPTQVSDSEGEWIEMYNDGENTVDLNTWMIDGKAIGNRSIATKEYLVIARELLDSTDNDTESFESYWGNNNGIWDENFSAIELILSLKEEDTIVLTNNLNEDKVSYNKSLGANKNGKTLERVSLTEWQEGFLDGTPGFGNFSTSKNNGDSISVFVEILNNIPEILAINLTDDADQEGIQIYPLLNGEKIVFVEVLINESDGFQNLEQVSFSVLNQTKNLSFKENSTTTLARFQGNFTLTNTIQAGNYLLEVSAKDTENQTTKNISFSYEGIISTELNLSTFEMSLHSGDAALRSVQVLNKGNIAIDTEVSMQELTSEQGEIFNNKIEVFQDVWLPLANPVFLDLNVAPQNAGEIQFRIQAPQQAKSGRYKGKITITSVESKNE
ncbi:MAG TPA: lamin tail domain-containing protein [Nanoarchaeota archaeon]|nr:lamin tail domain-containing protein [Nanoarchaeota archaeon]HIH58622.1 lamin tail domain-containing protein [Nanoarchaeota archaeon]HII13747.1 lamin tail domain-containing protein [Nanoarchaeota archaeon]HIJ04609.1 lamin tail domain-containing protein [Nanoarchaeota archaeon]